MAGLHWVTRPVLNEPVALLAFGGWGDAGESATAATETFLRGTIDRVAWIDPDDHFDFQVRRPTVEIDRNGQRHISWPENEIWTIRGGERDLVVVSGEEPHFRWKAFARELVDALQFLGVTKAVCVGAFIGQVAHTLPVPLVGTSNQPERPSAHGLLPSGYEGPTGILSLISLALGQAGIETISVWAAVPHYLSNQEYPPATEALVVKASELLGVSVDLDQLADATRQYLLTVDEAISSNEELTRYVQRLEEEDDGIDDDVVEDPSRLVEEIEDYLREQ